MQPDQKEQRATRLGTLLSARPALGIARIAAGMGLLLFATTLLAASRFDGPAPQPPPVEPAREPDHVLATDLLDRNSATPLPADAEEKLSSLDPAAQAEGAEELIRTIQARWPDDHRRAFLVRITPGALESAVLHCVPPSVTVGQAILESGWGRSGLAKRHNNLFGVKAGRSSQAVDLQTTEVVEGKRATSTHRFRTYGHWKESVTHHDRLLSRDPRYAAARAKWENWPRFLATVAPVYASDPDYVETVSGIVRTYRLDEWDELVTRVARRRSQCAAD